MEEELVTIKVAAKALKTSQRNIHRFFERGLLSKVKQGRRTYIKADDVRSLITSQKETSKNSHKAKVTDKDIKAVTIDITHYESLLRHIGELESQNQVLLEYRLNREEEIRQLKDEVAALKKELDKPILARLFGRRK